MDEQTLVMRGSLSEFGLPDVLQVVGVSRQHTVIELRKADGSRRGLIRMKAGQVLEAVAAGQHGRSAFFELFQAMRDRFHVFRMADSAAYPQPLGALTSLLFEAATQPEQAAKIGTESAADDGADTDALVMTADPPPPIPKTTPTIMPAMPAMPAIAPTRVPHVVPRAAARATPRLGPKLRPRTSPPHSLGGREPLLVAVASPKGGVGKTTITLNLALSLAERGLRTIIVDADVNGDILSAVNARDRVGRGAYELIAELLESGDATSTSAAGSVAAALRKTAQDGLRILPAAGRSVPVELLQQSDTVDGWRLLLRALRAAADIVLVDCPAGMFQTTGAVLQSCSHVVGVFQAEILSSRSFSMFLRGLGALPEDARPALAGVVVNMFQGRADFSMEAFHDVCCEERYRLFDTTIPRSEAFGRANMAGQPLRGAGSDSSPIAWLFDMLAEEVCQRVGASPSRDAKAETFLM